MYTSLKTSLEDQILTIIINRPDKLNALNKTVMAELDQVLSEIQSDDAIRSAIITGAGEKAFVAGADISEFVGLSQSEGTRLAAEGQRIFRKIEDSAKPVIAAVNGFALGGGCELAMACHFRVASENARFGQPEVNLGIMPGYGGTQRLVQLIGKGRAIEMLITANMIDADTALRIGLVNYVVPAAELIGKARAILSTANTKAPVGVAKCIEAANAVFDHAKDGFEVEADAFGHCFATDDMKEGTAAFLEKRKAAFRGR